MKIILQSNLLKYFVNSLADGIRSNGLAWFSYSSWLVYLFIFIPNGFATTSEADSTADLWAQLRSGNHFVLLRHAQAPGTGDPAGFELGRCETQRNLSAEGRVQAAALGDKFRQNGIGKARVYSSQWCRCLETGRLLGLGPVHELPQLNSVFQRYENNDKQRLALKLWLEQQDLTHPLVLISHQVNISALLGEYPQSGEMVVVKRMPDGQLSVEGTLNEPPN